MTNLGYTLILHIGRFVGTVRLMRKLMCIVLLLVLAVLIALSPKNHIPMAVVKKLATLTHNLIEKLTSKKLWVLNCSQSFLLLWQHWLVAVHAQNVYCLGCPHAVTAAGHMPRKPLYCSTLHGFKIRWGTTKKGRSAAPTKAFAQRFYPLERLIFSESVVRLWYTSKGKRKSPQFLTNFR